MSQSKEETEHRELIVLKEKHLDDILKEQNRLDDSLGAVVVREQGLKDAISRPTTFIKYGLIPKDNPHLLAATYVYLLKDFKPYSSGNKRVGVQAALICLDMNGFVVNVEPLQLLDEVRKESDVEDFAEFLRTHSEPVPVSA